MDAASRKKYEEDLKQMRPLDDDFMREMFRNNLPLAEFVLRIILDKPDLVLISQETQYDMKRLLGARSICLDVMGVDSEGRRYDVEVQRADKGARPKRARYHASAMDIEFLNQGQDFEELPVTYTIFITENDVFNQNQPLYEIDRVNTTIGKPFEDDEHIIYVNGAYVGDSPLGKLMHDFRCTSADEMYFDMMAAKTRYFKETPEGVSMMCSVVENRGLEMVREREVEIAVTMLKKGISVELVSEMTGIPNDSIQELAAKLNLATT